MKRLILFRHGKAEHTSTSGKDFDRALTERGREDARLVAEALARHGVVPDLVLVSEAARTQATWAAAQPAFPKPRVRVERALYQADAKTLLQTAEREAGGSIMIVTHNPGVHELALQLAEDAGDQALKAKLELGFPTAAAAVIDFETDGLPAGGRMVLPSDLGGGKR